MKRSALRKSALYLGLLIASALCTLSQTAGNLDLSHAVVASGGGSNSTGSNFRVDGTVGQNVAGTLSTSSQISILGGFWGFQALAPTAALAAISGQIRTSGGLGIRNVTITLTSISTGEIRTANTSGFGYYQFDGVLVGQAYILSVRSQHFNFVPSTRTVVVNDDLANIDFVSQDHN